MRLPGILYRDVQLGSRKFDLIARGTSALAGASVADGDRSPLVRDLSSCGWRPLCSGLHWVPGITLQGLSPSKGKPKTNTMVCIQE